MTQRRVTAEPVPSHGAAAVTSGTPKRLLVVAHELTLTGSPMNLLHFLRWVRRNTTCEVDLVAITDGGLRSQFDEVANVTVLDPGPVGGLLAALQGGLQYLGSSRAWRPVAALRLLPQLRRLPQADAVYCNSLPAISLVPYLGRHGPVIAHAHELAVAFRLMRPYDLALCRDAPDLWVAASQAVADVLESEIGAGADRVVVHHEFIDGSALAKRQVGQRQIDERRRELNIPPNAAVVVGSGTVEWRKGADLFVQLAAEVRRRRAEPVHFVWVGGDFTSADWQRVRSDRDRAGTDHVHFVGPKPDPVPWFAMGDVFALTSREDPFPLVTLENAALGKPIVSYRNGGVAELLSSAGPTACAGLVDHLDVVALANATIAFIDDERLAKEAGSSLQREVLTTHDVEVAAPALWRDICAEITRCDGAAVDR